VAYYPVIDILKSNFDIREGDGNWEIKEKVKKGLGLIRADEALTLPYLLELIAVKDTGIDPVSMGPEIKKERILAALRRIILQGSQLRPLVLVVEDLQWIDKSSEGSLRDLLANISGARVLLIRCEGAFNIHLSSRVCADLGRKILSQSAEFKPAFQPGKPDDGI
jgi:predicted ATPase